MACSVVRQALLIGLEAVPTDVGRQLVADQHQAVLGTADTPAGAGTSRLLTTGVRGPIAVAVGPRVDRVVQQVQQGPARGPMPLQSSPVGSVVRTYWDLNPVMHQVTQQAM